MVLALISHFDTKFTFTDIEFILPVLETLPSYIFWLEVGSSLPHQDQKIPVDCSLWLQASEYKHVTQVTNWKTSSGTMNPDK